MEASCSVIVISTGSLLVSVSSSGSGINNSFSLLLVFFFLTLIQSIDLTSLTESTHFSVLRSIPLLEAFSLYWATSASEKASSWNAVPYLSRTGYCLLSFQNWLLNIYCTHLRFNLWLPCSLDIWWRTVLLRGNIFLNLLLFINVRFSLDCRSAIANV